MHLKNVSGSKKPNLCKQLFHSILMLFYSILYVFYGLTLAYTHTHLCMACFKKLYVTMFIEIFEYLDNTFLLIYVRLNYLCVQEYYSSTIFSTFITFCIVKLDCFNIGIVCTKLFYELLCISVHPVQQFCSCLCCNFC